jgi:hypothetical protein
LGVGKNINRDIMKKIFFTVAVIGFIFSLIIHIYSILGIDLIGNAYIIGFIGVFIVFIPAILELKKNDGLKKNKNPIIFLKIVFRNTPNWLKVLTFIAFVYTMVNFWLHMNISEGGVPSIIDGEYVLHNHGDIIKNLTEEEYNKYEANTVRGFTGHMIFFYFFSLSILYPFNKSEK